LNILSRKSLGDFELQQFSKKHYRIIYKGKANRAIPMTGSDVTSTIPIDFTFVFKSIVLNHFTSSLGTASTDELQVTLRRVDVHGLDRFVDDFWKKTDLDPANGRIRVSFEDIGDEGGIVFEASTLQVILNSTTTDLVIPAIYIKRLD